MPSGRLCPRCGDTVTRQPEEPLPGAPRERDDALCDACYLDTFELVDAPDRIEVIVCATCGAVRRGDSWRDVDARDYTDVAVDEVRETLGVHLRAEDVSWGVDPEQVDETTVRMHCRFAGVVRDTPVEETVVVPVKIARGTCDRCGRIAGGYHNAVVQLRADGRVPTAAERKRALELAEAYIDERETAGDREAFIAETEETADGVDIKISTSQMGQGIATRITRALGGSVEHHPTLVTENEDGEEAYRVTYAVRLPEFVVDDVVDPRDGDGPVLVTGVGEQLTGTRLATGAEYSAPQLPADTRKLGTRADAVDTPLVAVVDANAMQVLDPDTYETVTVSYPEFIDPDRETVPVICHRSGVHVLPPTD